MNVTLSDDACPNCVISRNDVTSMHEKAHQLLAIHHESWDADRRLIGEFDDGETVRNDWIIESKLTANQYGAGDTKHLTQYGAEAIALQIAERWKRYYAYDRTAIGTGVDYALRQIGQPPPPADSLNFLEPIVGTDARMEVSGTTYADLFADRIKNKTRQTLRSDHVGTVAFVCVVDFATPRVHFSERQP